MSRTSVDYARTGLEGIQFGRTGDGRSTAGADDASWVYGYNANPTAVHAVSTAMMSINRASGARGDDCKRVAFISPSSECNGRAHAKSAVNRDPCPERLKKCAETPHMVSANRALYMPLSALSAIA
jgi:hypothetical protein